MGTVIKKNSVYMILGLCFLAFLWRSFKGFCWTDEAFYVSTADRFYRGGIPLVNEWFRTQLSSLVMLPFYAAYMLITGTNAGVILYFRILFLLFETTVSVIYFRVLRKDHPDHVAGAAAMFMMFYAYLNVTAFSYYMLSYLFTALAVILVYDMKNSYSRVKALIAGVSTALAVMCMPVFAAGFVIVLIALAAAYPVRRYLNGKEASAGAYGPLFPQRSGLWILAGIALCAAVFFIYLFSHISISYLVKTLPYALVDNEHSNTVGYYIRKPNRCFTEVFGKPLTYASYLLIAVSFVFQKVLKKRPFRYAVIAADMIIFGIMAYVSFGKVGYIQAVFFMFSLPVFFVSEKKNYRLFFLSVVPAVLIALIYCVSSSDFLYVMSIGFALASPFGACAMHDCLCGSSKDEDKSPGSGEYQRTFTAVRAALAAVCVICLFITFFLRIKNVYRDAPVSKLTSPITFGVAKGLYTTEEHLGYYTDVYEMIDEYLADTGKFEVISGNPSGNVLFSKILPWGYVAAAPDCGYPTTWRATAYDREQLDMYYGVNKTSAPDVIIVLDEQYGSYDAAGDTEDDHNPNLDEMSDYWKNYIADNGFTETRVKCGKIYCRMK